jgi:hypothetical protein
MRDQRGLYYYPFPQNKRVRMYVRQGDGEPEFRLWNQDDREMWQSHGWVPYSAVLEAKQMYTGGPFDPDKAYDLDAAKTLIRENS